MKQIMIAILMVAGSSAFAGPGGALRGDPTAFVTLDQPRFTVVKVIEQLNKTLVHVVVFDAKTKSMIEMIVPQSQLIQNGSDTVIDPDVTAAPPQGI